MRVRILPGAGGILALLCGGPSALAATGFEMPVADVFRITGQGTVVTGKVTSGSVSVGDTVCLGGRELTVAGIERFRKVLQILSEGEMGGLLFRDLDKKSVSKGDRIQACN